MTVGFRSKTNNKWQMVICGCEWRIFIMNFENFKKYLQVWFFKKQGAQEDFGKNFGQFLLRFFLLTSTFFLSDRYDKSTKWRKICLKRLLKSYWTSCFKLTICKYAFLTGIYDTWNKILCRWWKLAASNCLDGFDGIFSRISQLSYSTSIHVSKRCLILSMC